MIDDLTEITAQLDKQLDELFSKLDINMPQIQKEIYDRLTQFTSKIKTTGGKIVPSIENLKLLNGYKKELNGLLDESAAMSNVVKDFVSGIKQSTEYINDYFSILMSNFNVNDNAQLAKALQQDVISQTIDLLKGSGLTSNLIDPVRTILQRNITTSASYSDLQTEMGAYLDDTTKRYVKQITNDAVLGYERTYMLNIAQDLELNHYLYQGTKIATSRNFCIARTGKVYTEKEVKAWASLTWVGKRIGTNESSILYFVGGYNCRHRLLPISVEVYNSIKQINN